MSHLSNRIVYFSRGMGRGHAVPDSVIAHAIASKRPDIQLTFVSYATGALTLRQLGWNVIDLGLPEHAQFLEILIPTIPLLSRLSPALVIAHEEFAPLCVARGMDQSSIHLTDWFSSEDSLEMQSLRYADQVLFLDDAGYYDEPPYLKNRVKYFGYITEDISAVLPKEDCRRSLSIPLDATVVLCAPGGAPMFSEERTPFSDLLLRAFDLLPMPLKRLLWVCSDPDFSSLASKVGDRDDILLMKPHATFANTLQAADLLITKGNRGALFEGETLGIPSLSASFGVNPIDDYRVLRIRSHLALRARGLSPENLRDNMVIALTELPCVKPKSNRNPQRIDQLAECIIEHLDSIRK